MILVPLAIVVLARDLAPWVDTLSPQFRWALYGTAGLAMLGGIPFLLLLMWKTTRIENADLKSELLATCKHHKLYVHDIRVWKTDNQIVNALVAGVVPRLRVILMSDALVKFFPRHELLAILRHEAGHLRLWHLPTRIGFSVLPLLALAIDERKAVVAFPPNGVRSRYLRMSAANAGFGRRFARDFLRRLCSTRQRHSRCASEAGRYKPRPN